MPDAYKKNPRNEFWVTWQDVIQETETILSRAAKDHCIRFTVNEQALVESMRSEKLRKKKAVVG